MEELKVVGKSSVLGVGLRGKRSVMFCYYEAPGCHTLMLVFL